MKEAGIVVGLRGPTYRTNWIVDRIVGRRALTRRPGRVYHVKFNRRKVEGKDDVTGEDSTTRKDDQKQTVRKRLVEYHQMTAPLIGYYQKEAKRATPNTLKLTVRRLLPTCAQR